MISDKKYQLEKKKEDTIRKFESMEESLHRNEYSSSQYRRWFYDWIESAHSLNIPPEFINRAYKCIDECNSRKPSKPSTPSNPFTPAKPSWFKSLFYKIQHRPAKLQGVPEEIEKAEAIRSRVLPGMLVIRKRAESLEPMNDLRYISILQSVNACDLFINQESAAWWIALDKKMKIVELTMTAETLFQCVLQGTIK